MWLFMRLQPLTTFQRGLCPLWKDGYPGPTTDAPPQQLNYSSGITRSMHSSMLAAAVNRHDCGL